MSGIVQLELDLFGTTARAEQELAVWAARFERPDWIAPWDTAGGMKKGERRPGWRCPDPACGRVEPNEFLLSINHGWDPSVPGHEPFSGRCHELGLRANHAAYDAAHRTSTESEASA